MNKLKELVREAIKPNEFINSSIIAGRINNKHEGIKITPKQVEEFLMTEYYPEEEVKIFEDKFKGFDGSYHF